MKNTPVRNFAAIFAVLLLGTVVFAQGSKRIDFAKDGPSLVWEERVAANAVKEIVFYAKKGQKLSINMIDDTKMASMDLGKVSIDPNEGYEETITVSKDYTLYVTNNSNRSTSFRISMSLETPGSSTPSGGGSQIPSDAERIQFPKGSIEVNLEKTAPANGAKRFVIWAKSGQEIALTITPKNRNASLDIELDGNKVVKGQLFTMIAPRSGDYLLDILNADDRNQSFALDLGIGESAAEAAQNEEMPAERLKIVDNIASATRTINPGGSMDFVVNAKRSQKLGIQIGYEGKAKDIEGYLSEPGLQDISLTVPAESRKEFLVKTNGDHRLTISNMSNKKITFTIYVDLY